MVADFRFNGPQSYSPLLSALAEAPQNKAKLDILQEQNKRSRLNELLTNMSNAATVARNIQLIHQTRNQIQGQEKMTGLMNQTNPLAGAASAANPDAFSTGLAGVQAPFAGLDSMMGAAPQAGTGVPLQGEGVSDPKKAVIMNKLFPTQYEVSSNPDTGLREMVSKIPGMPIIPVDKPSAKGLATNPDDLNPVQRKALPELANKFNEESKSEQEVLLNVKEFQNLAKMKNPISDTSLKILTPRLTGIVARLNPTTLEAFGGSAAITDKIEASLQKAKSGTLTSSDRKFLTDFADVVGSSANDALKQKLDDAVSRAQGSVPGVHPSLLSKSIGGNTQDRIKNYKSISGQATMADPKVRFKQLTAGNKLSKQAAYAQMHEEGY